MRRTRWTTFKKKTKVDKELDVRFWEKVELFINDPFEPSLKTHKLSENLKNLWSFSLGYDEILFYFTDDKNAVFVDIGNHDEVY
ncbi:hypothetical protein [Rivularia sp. UHCC 0363]|uniref:type II toxin-antitoxin system RelE/ParE family toxin n=1 Tax=Rivularia sp. UHCC 0363 TaxID=3110244 RepID=UPI002B20043B|nr:hypothetical protein [Rivularia sp. UHCC 0363]MEA5594497.1 hypothetical protein [Rivularia sp. UHCC 0363]